MRRTLAAIGLPVLLAFAAALRAATPEIVAEEPELPSIDTVELHGNGVYWWSSSACSGDVIQRGGASFVAYTDPRLKFTAPGIRSTVALAGGFQGGDVLDLGPAIGTGGVKGRSSPHRGFLLPGCNYGSHFVRDDEAFYFARDRKLFRKSLSSIATAPGASIDYVAELKVLPLAADGVLQVTDTEVWSFTADLAQNSINIVRTWKSGSADFSRIRNVLTMPGVGLRKFAIADIQNTDGSHFGSELILLSGNGDLYLAASSGANLRRIHTGVSDFAFRNESYGTVGPLGVERTVRTTTLYIALGHPITHSGNGRLIRRDLTSGARGEFTEFDAPNGQRITSVAVDRQSIFLTRTPRSGQPNSELLRRRAPVQFTFSNPAEAEYSTIGVSREFRSLRSTGRLVYFAHGNTVQRLSVNAPSIDIDFEAVHIEVTQGIQNLDNSVPLVAGKKTIIRGYAQLGADNTGLRGFDVPAKLRVYHSPRVPLGEAIPKEVEGSPFLPVVAPAVTVMTNLPQTRMNPDATFVFEVPDHVIRDGKMQFEFILNDGRVVPETGADPLANNRVSKTLLTRAFPYPIMVFAPMKYGGGHYDFAAPNSSFWEIVARARSMLPVAGIQVYHRQDRVVKPVVIFPGVSARSFDMPEDQTLALWWLSIARTFDSSPLNSHYVGMFPDGTAQGTNFNGIAWVRSRVSNVRMAGPHTNIWPANTPLGGRILAHEYLHNLNFNHIITSTNCTGQIPDGPYDTFLASPSGCTLGATDLNNMATFAGFDALSWSAINPGDYGDIMSYAWERWTSEFTWMRFYNLWVAAVDAQPFARRIANRHRARPAAPSAEYLVVHGILNEEGTTAELLPAHIVPESLLAPGILDELTSVPAQLPANHPFHLQLLDLAGAVVADHKCPIEDGTESGKGIRRAIPMEPSARSMRLLNGNQVLATRSISSAPPTLSVEPPKLVNGKLELAWKFSDADGDPLIFTIQLSPDDGQTWQTVRVNASESGESLDARELPGGESSRIRIIATDGARTSIAVSERISLPKHVPEATITGITDGQEIEFGSVTSAGGFVYDAEDGSLSDSSLAWTLSGPESSITTGSSFSIGNLSPGAYSLTLTGTDSSNQKGAATTRFSIRPPSIPESTEPKLDGLCADLGYSRTPAMRLAITNGNHTTARFTHANGALFACFTGLRYGADDSSGAIAGLRVSTGGSGDVRVNAGFAVNSNGDIIRLGGEGASISALAEPPPGFRVVILRDENTWSAEMRIADELLGGWDRQLGLVAYVDDGSAATPAATWPPGIDIEKPDSWVPVIPGGSPEEEVELLTNGSFEDTQDVFVSNGAGIMLVPTDSTVIGGWTNQGPQIAWIDNTNSFQVATPYGSKFLDLTGYRDAAPGGEVSQVIRTIPGRRYRLSFALGSNAIFPGAGGPKSVLARAGDYAAAFALSPTNKVNDHWETFRLGFIATESATTISIKGLVPYGNYLGLDNLSVVADRSEPPVDPVNLVINGDFEEPSGFEPDGNGAISIPLGSTVMYGWATVGEELSWGVNANPFGLRTPHGALFLDLTGYHDRLPYAGVSQVLTTVPGGSYRLSFSLGTYEDAVIYRGPVSVMAMAGSVSNRFTFAPTGKGNQWKDFSMNFTADSGETPLTIVGTESGGGQFLGLDKISVTPGGPDPGDVIRIEILESTNVDITLRFLTRPGRTYALESRTELEKGTWTLMPETTRTSNGASLELTIPIVRSEPTRFFRVVER